MQGLERALARTRKEISMNIIFSTSLNENVLQTPARPLPLSQMAALTDCIAQVFDNGLRFVTAGLVAGGSFWSLLAGCNQQFKPHCDHSGAVIFSIFRK